jgi:hypothetical protein
MGRRKRNGNITPPKTNLVQDSEGNEENGYPVPDSNKTKINDKEANNVHKNTFKEETLQAITKNFMEMLPKCTRGTQEISRHQKKRIEEHRNKSNS